VPDSGNPQSLNRYAYALNNSLKYTDPDGCITILATAGVGATIGFVTGGVGYLLNGR